MHFNVSITFFFIVLKNLKKYHKGYFAGHCPIYVYDPRLKFQTAHIMSLIKLFASPEKLIIMFNNKVVLKYHISHV